MTEQPDVRYPRSLAGGITPKPVCDDVSIVILTLGRGILETCLAYISTLNLLPGSMAELRRRQAPTALGDLARST